VAEEDEKNARAAADQVQKAETDATLLPQRIDDLANAVARLGGIITLDPKRKAVFLNFDPLHPNSSTICGFSCDGAPNCVYVHTAPYTANDCILGVECAWANNEPNLNLSYKGKLYLNAQHITDRNVWPQGLPH
jgi:hypothetical protein